MVFGLRDAADNWQMTLVKNASVEYQKIQIKTRFLKKDKRKLLGETRDTKSFDPDGNERVLAVPLPPVQYDKIQNCHTLGYQDFFPGAGAAQMHDLTQIAVF